MWILLLLLACSSAPADTAPATGGDPADGGASGGGTDGGGDGGSGADCGGSGDGGEPGCDSRAWRTEATVRLSRQAEVDAFCDTANAVDGDLVIDLGGSEDPITQLDGVGCLCEVTGSLTITGDADRAPPVVPTPPPHVTGDLELTMLERVGGDLHITFHPSLTYVEAMRSLREVGGDILLAGNPEMQVTSFYGLERLGGRLILREQDKQLILRLPAATTVGGLDLGETGDAATMAYLVEIKLDALRELTGDLRLVGARNLAVLSAPQLTRIDGDLHLEAACRTTLSLPVLEQAGSVVLDGLCALEDLGGLSALRRITGQDALGRSLRLHADDGLDSDEIAAFLDQLDTTGTGTIDTANDGACADLLDAYGADYCD